MSTTVMLTGLLPFVVLIASVLAVPVSWFLLRLYRRAVRRGMIAGATANAGTDRVAISPPASELQITELSAPPGGIAPGGGSPDFRTAAYACWRTAAIYAAGGAVYAAIMTTGLLLSDRTQTVVLTKIALLFWIYFWPPVPATVLVAAYDRVRRLQVFGAYVAVLLVIAAVVLARNPDLSLWQLLLYWIITNAPPTVLIMAFLYRPVRAVGPLVLAFLIAIAAGSQLLLSVAQHSTSFLRAAVQAGSAVGLGATAIFVAMIVVGMVGLGLLAGWPMLRSLGSRYGRKKFSDQSLILDAVWLVFGVVQSFDLAFNGPAWILTGVVGLLGYKVVSVMGHRRLAAARRTRPPRMLLLLRVFALGKRSERLFDKLRKHWQYAGGICMISGPDLVTSTVEPHEFLDFLRGRIGRQFVSSALDLEQRISAMDRLPDPDARYRISEFFCHNDTWQMTVDRLATASDVVLMDLRSFSSNNRGCLYELGRLLDGIDLRKVVLLVDPTTDPSFLRSTLRGIWQSLDAHSPNRRQPAPAVRLFSVSAQDEPELRLLLGHLLAATS